MLNNLHTLLMAYGEFIRDIEYDNDDGCHRIRIISYDGDIFYDHMHNGNVIDCIKIGTDRRNK